MRKNNSLPELNTCNLSPEKFTDNGWLTNKNKYKYASSYLSENSGITNLRTTMSVFPHPRKDNNVNRPRKTRNKRRSLENIKKRVAKNQFITMDKRNRMNFGTSNFFSTLEVFEEEDSDLFAMSDSITETEEETGRYVGKEAFKHYYKNYK
jgi:hypothetical protein